MLVQPARKQPGNDVEILVVMRGEPAGVALGIRDRASGRRQPTPNFEFSGYLHDAGPVAQPVGHGLAKFRNSRDEACATYGITATFISPLRCFMCSNIFGRSMSGISAFTKSFERISPRDTLSRASRMNRGV